MFAFLLGRGDELSHLEALPEAERLRGLSLGATLKKLHQLSFLTNAASPADCPPTHLSVCME